ncbi:hypothetical protein CRU98_11305 [Arcobacter sp. CECT 8986]|uniref:hypothetical protein n=1 Tax=Arcobacter sp. CECT 8986 TaxID=2044507 RepID=UPI001009F280|nr:hypothetical protein [Arcobacter sp. CECT 8986]RXJ98097.1 hypothetical protein CRU98_11305 [Arcobacter sp. CECT 8986]
MIKKTRDTENLKSYIKNIVVSEGLKLTSSSRHCYHIRFMLKGDLDSFNDLFNKFNIVVLESDYSCSSKSPTYILKNSKEVNGIPINTELYWVNNDVSSSQTGSKLFATKDLSPDSLNVAGEEYVIDSLIKNVTEQIIEKYNKSCISSQLINLLYASNEKGKEIHLKKELEFSSDDLIVISKDFGEILAAIWVMKNFNFKSICFPKNSNEKMIDFYAERLKIKYPISVKSGKGGKVLLQNIIDLLNKRAKKAKKNIKEEPIYKIIQIVNNNSAKSQMIKIHQYLKTNMIKDISRIVDKPVEDITLDFIKEWSNGKSVDELKDVLSTWWKEYSQPKKFEVKDQERLIIAPLGEAIKYTLNKDKKLKESLDFLAKQVCLLQINVDVKSDKIIFNNSFFKDSTFEFGWPGYSSGNKLGFRMLT